MFLLLKKTLNLPGGCYMQQRLISSLSIWLLASTSFAAVTTPGQASAIPPVPSTPVAKGAVPIAAPSPSATILKTDKDKISYAIGVDMGTNLKAQNIDVNPDMLARGLKDASSNAPILLSQQEIGNTLANLQKQIISKREADFKAQADKNKHTGDAFLQANKTKPGVISLASGLQYKIITQGNGQQPTDKDIVTVNYSGHLINGQEFDSSYRHGKPAQFPVAEVIPGWSEALRLMKTGSTWEIYVPPQLAYGERGLPGGPIGPNQALIFTVNLISIDKKKTSP
jgi:FKBP-type peptidyl-prolyl cis-trans isomerase FklB